MRRVLVLVCLAISSACCWDKEYTQCTKLENLVVKGGFCDGTKIGSRATCTKPDVTLTWEAEYVEESAGEVTEEWCMRSKASRDTTCALVGSESKDICGKGKTDYCKERASFSGRIECSKDDDCPGPEPEEEEEKKPCCSNYKATMNNFCIKVDSAKYTEFVSDLLILSLSKQAACGTRGAPRYRLLLRSVATILTLFDLNAGSLTEGGRPLRRHRLRDQRCWVAARRSSRTLDGNRHRLRSSRCLLSHLLTIETYEGDILVPGLRNDNPSMAEAVHYMT